MGFPRLVKANAQAVLFDYLHYTRGLSFVEVLLAKVESEKDVVRALARLFRYNPINEYEPFFESIGLSQRDFAPLLPRGLIFLSDDPLFQPHGALGFVLSKRTKTVLKEFIGDRYSLCQALEKDPLAFFLAIKTGKCDSEFEAARNPNNIVQKTDVLLRIGYIENSDEMVKAFKCFAGRGDQLQERFACLVDASLDFNIVSSMAKHAPWVLNQTIDTLKKKIDCLKHYLGYPVDSIAGFPSYLSYDTERTSVRVSMYAWLREKGRVKSMISASMDIHP